MIDVKQSNAFTKKKSAPEIQTPPYYLGQVTHRRGCWGARCSHRPRIAYSVIALYASSTTYTILHGSSGSRRRRISSMAYGLHIDPSACILYGFFSPPTPECIFFVLDFYLMKHFFTLAGVFVFKLIFFLHSLLRHEFTIYEFFSYARGRSSIIFSSPSAGAPQIERGLQVGREIFFSFCECLCEVNFFRELINAEFDCAFIASRTYFRKLKRRS